MSADKVSGGSKRGGTPETLAPVAFIAHSGQDKALAQKIVDRKSVV